MTDPTRVAAALAMSEGQSAIADRSQMDGVVLATLHEKQVAVTRLRSASFRSRFSVQNKDELRGSSEMSVQRWLADIRGLGRVVELRWGLDG
jgi:hypothetical protein